MDAESKKGKAATFVGTLTEGGNTVLMVIFSPGLDDQDFPRCPLPAVCSDAKKQNPESSIPACNFAMA